MKVLSALVLLFVFVSCNYLAEKNSNEVLDAFDAINNKFEDANRAMIEDNDSLLLKVQAYPNYKTQLKSVAIASEQLISLLDSLKLGALAIESDYEKMDSSQHFDNLLFSGNVPSETGLHLISLLQNYNDAFQNNFKEDFPKLTEKVRKDFSTKTIKGKHWLSYNFKGFPSIATITKFTQIASDVLTANRALIGLISEEK